MNRPVGIECVVAGAVAWIGSLLAAALYVAPNAWAGAHDLPRMALWSLPFAAVIALAAALVGSSTRTRGPFWMCGPFWMYGAAAVLGPALGVGSFAAAVALRGGWAVAFPVFSCWAFGGLLGLVAAVLTARPRSTLVAAGLTLAALGALLWSHAALRRLG